MKNIIVILLLSMAVNISFGQNSAPTDFDSLNNSYYQRAGDSLIQVLKNYSGPKDTSRQGIIFEQVFKLLFSRPRMQLYAAQEGLRLSRAIKNPYGEAVSKMFIGMAFWGLQDYSKASQIAFENLELSESLKDNFTIGWCHILITNSSRDIGDYNKAIKFSDKNDYQILGSIYEEWNRLDSALFYLQKASPSSYVFLMLGHTYSKLDSNKLAFGNYQKSISENINRNNLKDITDAYIGLAKLYEKEGKLDSCIYYAKKGYQIAQKASFSKWVFQTSVLLSGIYEKTNISESLNYLKLAMAAKDSMINLQKMSQYYSSEFSEDMRQQKLQQTLEQSQLKYKNRLKLYILFSGLLILLMVAVGLWRRNIYRKKSISLLQKQKEEIQSTLTQLKSTQAQLIQSEKMASLGELTAGIAHEIQNPLNFVNNFSEVNKEMLEELKAERLKPKAERDDDLQNDLINNVIANEEKINHHGKRADAIVKGMLQHSQKSSGQKEQTDINALCDEYLRLSYHGLRAKDKSFNTDFKTEFDNSIGKINIIPQDIGRVLLNLFNNAFYTVTEKNAQHIEGYEPTVSVSTKLLNFPLGDGGKVEIKVADNGNGIPQKVLDKIFQPFFTTKPTGQGTGLGLSLSYDIIKAHGGEIKVETKEGVGTIFIIRLSV